MKRASTPIVGATAWIGAMLERLARGQPPLPGFEEAVVRHDRAQFDPGATSQGPELAAAPRERWALPAPAVTEGLGSLLSRLHEQTRGAEWEADLWFWLLQFLPDGLPDAVAHDLIDREIAVDALGHCNLTDAALWRLAGWVDEALLTLSKRRYVSAEHTADQFEEVLYAFPQHKWMLMSLPSLLPSSHEKAERLAARLREHPRRDELLRHACDDFLDVWGRSAAKHGRK